MKPALGVKVLHPNDVLTERYRLLNRVGGGGMGDVWKGEDLILNRTVAIKVLLNSLSQDFEFRERFRREARAVASLEGPGIAEVYDYGEISLDNRDIAFLVMRHIEGVSLSHHIALHGRLDVEETLRIIAQTADALQLAHDTRVIHRDIKPGNILLGDDGRTTLVDFGISKTATDLTMTRSGTVLGTIIYMSPEQALGERIQPTSDVYSLGVVAHQCLAGVPPFRADTPLGLISAHLSQTIEPLPAHIPAEVRELVARAMSRQPGDRWRSAAELAGACRRVNRNLSATTRIVTVPTLVPRGVGMNRPSPVKGGGQVRRVGAPVKSRRRFRNLWLIVALVCGMVFLGTTITMASSWGDDKAIVEPGSSTSTPPVGGPSLFGPGTDATMERPPDLPSSADQSASPSAPESHQSSSADVNPSLDTVVVPNVVNMTESQARQTLMEEGFLSVVVYEGEGQTPCRVLSQHPVADDVAEKGSAVTITVQQNDTCTM